MVKLGHCPVGAQRMRNPRVIYAVLVCISTASFASSAASQARSAGCGTLNSLGLQTNVAFNGSTNTFAAGEIITGRLVYTPDAGTRLAFFDIITLVGSVTRQATVYANSGLSRYTTTVGEDLVTNWGRGTTDAGTNTTFRVTCQIGVPSITGLSSTTGPAGGGGTLTITGVDLGATTAVNFGATPATSIVFTSNTSLTVGIPAGAGVQNVTVVDSTGTSAGSPYTYVATPIPTLSEWALIAFGTILAAGAALLIQRRNRFA